MMSIAAWFVIGFFTGVLLCMFINWLGHEL